MKTGQLLIAALLTTTALAAIPGCTKPEKTAPPMATVKDERAFTALQQMSDTLKQARSMTFTANSSVAIVSPTGQWVHVFGASMVSLQRPDHLYVETRGDMFPENFYYDGKTVTMFAPVEKLYATDSIAGNLDQTLLQIFQKHGTYFSFADVVQAIPRDAMAKDVTTAQFVGQSIVGGVVTSHLAFTSPTMEWEIWIGNDDHLPRLLDVTYSTVTGRPACSVSFADWALNPTIAADTFTFTPPQGAAKIEFHKIDSPLTK